MMARRLYGGEALIFAYFFGFGAADAAAAAGWEGAAGAKSRLGVRQNRRASTDGVFLARAFSKNRNQP
jgi:hypothetical protein